MEPLPLGNVAAKGDQESHTETADDDESMGWYYPAPHQKVHKIEGHDPGPPDPGSPKRPKSLQKYPSQNPGATSSWVGPEDPTLLRVMSPTRALG